MPVSLLQIRTLAGLPSSGLIAGFLGLPTQLLDPLCTRFLSGLPAELLAADGIWDTIHQRLLAAADQDEKIGWTISVDSTIARAHQHATNITRHTEGWGELHESEDRAA